MWASLISTGARKRGRREGRKDGKKERKDDANRRTDGWIDGRMWSVGELAG